MKPTYSIHSTNWKAVASSDNLRPAMKGVYFDKQKNQLVATNGHVLLIMPIESTTDADESAIIPIDAFNKKAESYTVTKKETIVNYSSGKKEVYPNIQEIYPNYESVIPKNSETDLSEIGIDMQLFAQLYKCLKPLSDKKKVKTKLVFSGFNKGIRFELLSDKKVRGLVMPYLLNSN